MSQGLLKHHLFYYVCILTKTDELSDNMVQLYRECFRGEQPISEFLFTEFMYSEENH